MVRNAVASLAVAALGAGCAAIGTANVDPAHRPAGNGLLVASLSASGYLPGTLWFQVVQQGHSARPVASIPVNDSAFGIDWPVGDPALVHGGLGRLAVVELPPGDYEVRRWVINVSNTASYASTRAFGYRFAIAPGKATYLGNVHVDLQRAASDRGVPFAISLEDRRARDLALLHRKYPRVSAAIVAFAGERAPDAGPRGPARLEDLRELLPP